MMEPASHRVPEPDRQAVCCRVVRDVLAFLAAHHPTIKADDVAHLAENLLDWAKLVEVDFPRDWQETIQRMKTDSERSPRN